MKTYNLDVTYHLGQTAEQQVIPGLTKVQAEQEIARLQLTEKAKTSTFVEFQWGRGKNSLYFEFWPCDAADLVNAIRAGSMTSSFNQLMQEMSVANWLTSCK